MIPQLYYLNGEGSADSRIGGLHQALTCRTIQEINGEYALELTMPIGAEYWESLELGNGIQAKPDVLTDPQMFTIEHRRRATGGLIEVYAVHQSYRFNSVMVTPFLNNGVLRSAKWAFGQARANAVNPPSGLAMTYSRSIDPTGGPHLLKPASLRSYLLEDLAPNWGGEFRFDGLTVEWLDEIGTNRGARISYGGNLLSLEEEQAQEYESGIYPYYGEAGSTDRPLVEIPGKILMYPITAPLRKIIPMDTTSWFEAQPSPAQLLAEAQRYAAARSASLTDQSLTIEKVWQKGEKPICVGDTVNVLYTKFGIQEDRRAKRMIFDVLKERVETIELGEKRSTLASNILNQTR